MEPGGPQDGWQNDQSRWTIQQPPDAPPPAPRKRGPLLAIVIVLVAVLVAGAGAFALTRGGSSSPANWDAQITPIARAVESIRGLKFKHAVKVNYLDDAAFEKKFAITSKLTKKEQDQVDESAALFRAAGLAGPGFDIRKAASTAQSAGVLGYYEPKSKQIYVRGKGKLNVYATVTLAHELTHVLQDQYFEVGKREDEIGKSKTASSDAFRAVVEGDAVTVQNAYLKAQNKAFNDEYTSEQKKFATQDTARSKDVPAAVAMELQAPYLFGPPVIDVLSADGHDAVNQVLKSGEPTTAIFFDPTQSALRGTTPVAPKLRAGEVESKISPDHDFDSFTLFVMLASRLDAVTALDAVDAYQTGSSIQYKRGDTTCFRATITADVKGEAALANAVKRWTQAVPDAAVESARPLTFHACDAGAKTKAPPNPRIVTAVLVASQRDEFVALAMKQGTSADKARCLAHQYIESPIIVSALANNRAPSTIQIQATATLARTRCQSVP